MKLVTALTDQHLSRDHLLWGDTSGADAESPVQFCSPWFYSSSSVMRWLLNTTKVKHAYFLTSGLNGSLFRSWYKFYTIKDILPGLTTSVQGIKQNEWNSSPAVWEVSAVINIFF